MTFARKNIQYLHGGALNNLSVIGTGRLGLCFCLTLEAAGYNVVGCDVDQDYVNSINDKSFCSFEPGVNERLKASQNFVATTSLSETVEHSQMMFVTVASYSEPDGRYDVSQVDSVVNNLISLGIQGQPKHLVICTNVNPGYSDTVYERLRGFNWEVSFNPETIAQGTILKNQSEPDCIYIGSESSQLAQQISETYANMCTNKPSVHIMDRLSAELTKVSLNCYLTCKISFANMVGDLASKMGANPDKILAAVGSDSRINNKFFRYGFGWGGPCFPRDTRAFVRLAKNNAMPSDMCVASTDANDKHLEYQVEDFIATGRKEYRTDSVTYKKGTIILEEAQQLKFAVELANRGIKVTVEESEEVIKQLKNEYGDLLNYGK